MDVSSVKNSQSKLLLDKLHPVAFKPARHAESGDMKPSSYVVIGQRKSVLPKKRAAPKAVTPKPKLMAEAVAAYTGRKFKEKRQKSKKPHSTESPKSGKTISNGDAHKNETVESAKDVGADIGEDIGEDLGEDLGEDIGQDIGEDVREDIGKAVGENSESHQMEENPDSDSSDDVYESAREDAEEKSDEKHESIKGIELDDENDEDYDGEESSGDDDDEDVDDDNNDDDVNDDDGEANMEDDDDDDGERTGKEQFGLNAQASTESSNSVKAPNSPNQTDNQVDHASFLSTDSVDASAKKRVHSKLALKMLASDDLKNLNEEILSHQQALNPDTKSGSTLPSRTASSDEADELLYGQNLDYTKTNFYQLEELDEDHGLNGSTRIQKNWGPDYLRRKPVGLLNLGVTCYTNTALQAMLHIPAVQHYLDEVRNGKSEAVSSRSVTAVVADLAGRMWSAGLNRYVNPKKLIRRLDDVNCMMLQWQQEDLHEYFMLLLLRFQEDLTPPKLKLNSSILYDIFGGLLNQAVICKGCNHISRTQQEFYDLSLSLDPKKKRKITPTSKENSSDSGDEKSGKKARYSVINAIGDFFEPELIRVSGKSSGYDCLNCGKSCEAMKYSSIARAPETLVIHIKRFRFNGTSNSLSKLKSLVLYPLILDLSSFEHEQVEQEKKDLEDKEPIRYQLISVVVHEGRSISSGHYIAHCRQPSGEWNTYDDEYVNTILESRALHEPNAYYLIYTRLKYKGNEDESSGKTKKTEKRNHRKRRRL